MANPKTRPRYGPTPKRTRGQPEAECGFRQDCRMREFLFGLDDDELAMGLEGADPLTLAPILTSMGVKPKLRTHRGRQVFRIRLRTIPQEVQHYALAVLASPVIVELANTLKLRSVDENGEEKYEEDIDVNKVMRDDGGLVSLVENWPLGLVRLVLESFWDDGHLTLEQRDEMLAAIEDPAILATWPAPDPGGAARNPNQASAATAPSASPVAATPALAASSPVAPVVSSSAATASAGAPGATPGAPPAGQEGGDDDHDGTEGNLDGDDVVCGDDRARLRAIREAASGHQLGQRPTLDAAPPPRAAPVPHEGTTPLDALLAQAVDNAEATVGAGPELTRLTAAIECALLLDPSRPDLWRLYGRVVAMGDVFEPGPSSPDPDPDTAPPAPSIPAGAPAALRPALPTAALELLRGQLHTLAVRGDSDHVGRLVAAHPEQAEQLLRLFATAGAADSEVNAHAHIDHATDPVPAAILTAYLKEPRRAARLLRVATEPFASWPAFMKAARAQATELIAGGAAIEAEILLRAVEATLWQWAARPDRPGHGLEQEASEIAVLRAVCRRHRRDFAGALQLLQNIDRRLLDSASRAAASRETGLATAEIAGLSVVGFPRRAIERLQMRERLARARPHLEEALEADAVAGDPQLVATVLLGLLAACEDDDAGAVRHLGTAGPVLAERPAAAELAHAVAFHAALARLRLLEPGTDDAAFHQMSSAIAAGYVPADTDLVSAAVALEAHASPHAGAFLATATSLAPNAPDLIELLADQARRSDPAAAAVAEERAGDCRLSLATRYTLFDSVLTGARLRNDVAAAARLADEIEEVLVRAGQVALDEAWAETLATDETLRLALEPAHADATRLEVLRRIGRLDEARAIAKSLFYRAANGTLRGFDAGDLAALMAELGTADEELADLERLVHDRPGQEDSADAPPLTSPLRVVFVGGSPVQEHYVPHLDAVFAERYNGMLSVDWFMTGWGSNWAQAAERIEVAFEKAAAVVVMTFVRTNLGRWTRRTAGEHGLPWLSCTGHGRASLERSIDRAVAVAVEQAGLA